VLNNFLESFPPHQAKYAEEYCGRPSQLSAPASMEMARLISQAPLPPGQWGEGIGRSGSAATSVTYTRCVVPTEACDLSIARGTSQSLLPPPPGRSLSIFSDKPLVSFPVSSRPVTLPHFAPHPPAEEAPSSELDTQFEKLSASYPKHP